MTRIRTSDEKAALLSMLTDEQAEQMLADLSAKAEPEFALQKKAPTYKAPFTTGNTDNVFVIGDLHAPFIREGYLEWCREQQEKYNCGTVVAIGDIVDAHSLSYHEHDPDGMSVGTEIDAARVALAKVFAMFPEATCLLGNHDLLLSRKARTAGLSQRQIKTIAEVYDAPPTWSFVHETEIHGVTYQHGGAGGKADRIAQQSRKSTVQGHFHMESFVHHYVSDRDAIWGMQVGAGQDDKAYAMAYGKPYPRKSAIGAGVVLDKGKVPFTVLMDL